jgi:hypothetical protein
MRLELKRLQLSCPGQQEAADQLESLGDFRVHVGSVLQTTVRFWVDYRLELSKENVSDPPSMPFSLRESMSTHEFEQTKCTGGNGLKRAADLLFSMWVSGLAPKFKEWQANIAAQDLLTTIQQDVDGIQATKKSKKKKNKKTGVVESQAPIDVGACENGSISPSNATTSETERTPVPNSEVEKNTFHLSQVNDVEYQPPPFSCKIGLFDKTGFQSAEAFFVARLVAVLDNKKNQHGVVFIGM